MWQALDNGVEALRDLSVTIPEGSMAFLSGHVGAGKSTFLEALAALGGCHPRQRIGEPASTSLAWRQGTCRATASTWAWSSKSTIC